MSAATQWTEDGGRSAEVRRAVARLADLPASLRVVQEALKLCDDPLSSNGQLEGVLRADPGAAADVLRVANSPFYGVGSEIENLAMAVTVMGRDRLRVLLLHLMAAAVFEKLSVKNQVALSVRNRALAAAVASRAAGVRTRHPSAAELLIAGLLHNAGEMALLVEMPRACEEAARLSRMMPLARAQIAVFGVAGPVITRWLLDRWGFPARLKDAAEFWPAPNRRAVPGHERSFVCCVHAGVRLAGAWVDGEPVEDACRRVLRPALERTGLKPDALKEIYGEIGSGVRRLKELL